MINLNQQKGRTKSSALILLIHEICAHGNKDEVVLLVTATVILPNAGEWINIILKWKRDELWREVSSQLNADDRTAIMTNIEPHQLKRALRGIHFSF